MSHGIVLIGPSLPFRGGISQYNTALHAELYGRGLTRSSHSFSRQYPKWLYPGKSDIDPARENHAEPGMLYSIDSLNPFTWTGTARTIAADRPDLVVFHWWTVFWLPCFASMIWLLKRKGIRVAFICHNLADHDSSGLVAKASRRMLSAADAYIVHSTKHADILAKEEPGKPLIHHPIPIYGHYPLPKGTLDKRGRLELLFFGFIRPYKGLDVLIKALSLLHDTQIYLTVVGETWGNEDALTQLAATAPNIELHLEYTSDEEAAEYFDRADIVVLPYRNATGSAVASVAYHYDKPILATNVGGLPDVIIDQVTGLLVEPGDPQALTSVLASITRDDIGILSEGVRSHKKKWDWSSLADMLVELASQPRPQNDGKA